MPDDATIRRAGAMLRSIRVRLGLSLREVGRLSLKLVEEHGNREFGLSRAWLTDIEKGEFVPGTYKIASLSSIYQLSIAEINRFYGFEPGDIVRRAPLFRPPKTHLIDPREESGRDSPLRAEDVLSKSTVENTDLLTRIVDIWGDVPVPALRHIDLRRYLYAYIGTTDRSMAPLLPPGTFLQIDAKQSRVQRGPWKNVESNPQFARPIYFLDIRTAYLCGYCDIRDGILTFIPHPDSGLPTRTFRYPDEVDIVGQVVGIARSIVGESFLPPEGTNRRTGEK